MSTSRSSVYKVIYQWPNESSPQRWDVWPGHVTNLPQKKILENAKIFIGNISQEIFNFLAIYLRLTRKCATFGLNFGWRSGLAPAFRRLQTFFFFFFFRVPKRGGTTRELNLLFGGSLRGRAGEPLEGRNVNERERRKKGKKCFSAFSFSVKYAETADVRVRAL